MNKTCSTKLNLVFFLIALLLNAGNTFADSQSLSKEIITKAQAMVNQREYESAFELLLPLESQMAGDLIYDRLLAVAAVESGHVTVGMLALERAAAVDPDNQQLRTEIAKAHFLLGEIDASRAEYKQLLKYNPSPETARTIEKYMAAIDKAIGLTTTFNGFFEAGLGWDSNVNSANTIGTTVSGTGNIGVIAPEARKQSSALMNLIGGAGFRVPVNENISYVGNLRFSKSLNQQAKAFEVADIDANIGIQFKQDNNIYTVSAQNNHFFVDDNRFRQSYGLTAQWQHNYSPITQAGIYLQYAKLDYDDNAVRNAHRYVLGSNFARAFQGDLSPLVFMGAYIGLEDATSEGSSFLDQHIYGLRAGGQLTFNSKWMAYLSSGIEFRRNQDLYPIYFVNRHDDQYDLTLGVHYEPAKYWTIKPQVSLIKNNSNIDLFEFNRAIMTINVRRDFNW